ncbi:MAG: hypothetical protein M5R36_06120 [Deltaproteobacteria bacterium]|nr:hypothetical protein [Deltaproteobacteria bacterium]
MQGVEGAYSYLAANKFFAAGAAQCAFIGYKTFADAVKACERGDLDFVVLPVENTIGGSINATYRLLEDSALVIIGEEIWRVEHCLIGLEKVPLGRIRHIASHPQALLQCGEFLSQMQDCAIESFTDTAEAVRRVGEMQDITRAAIASREAAERYGLHVLKSDIADQRENYTKLVIVAREAAAVDPRVPCKISMRLVTDHSEGALLACLRPRCTTPDSTCSNWKAGRFTRAVGIPVLHRPRRAHRRRTRPESVRRNPDPRAAHQGARVLPDPRQGIRSR